MWVSIRSLGISRACRSSGRACSPRPRSQRRTMQRTRRPCWTSWSSIPRTRSADRTTGPRQATTWEAWEEQLVPPSLRPRMATEQQQRRQLRASERERAMRAPRQLPLADRTLLCRSRGTRLQAQAVPISSIRARVQGCPPCLLQQLRKLQTVTGLTDRALLLSRSMRTTSTLPARMAFLQRGRLDHRDYSLAGLPLPQLACLRVAAAEV